MKTKLINNISKNGSFGCNISQKSILGMPVNLLGGGV